MQDLLDANVPTVPELALKYKVPVAKVQHELDKGTKVEQEHTSQPAVARRIALAHLAERLDYYDQLSKFDEEAAGVGLVVPGVNMPAGMHPDEIRRQAKKWGFKVSARGVPPVARTNGKLDK